MSKVIDERVVSMQFDNKHFESNVQTTLSTLDKLKAKLNFTGSAKGLENINTAAGRCNLSPLSSAVDSVGIKFNGLYTIADQALRNITNSAMRTGERIMSALTIDPVKTGLSEYETQINSTQTILANVKQKGKGLPEVNAALEELNKYADKTIYNFTEMTRNIGLFTNAGVDLDDSVNAIKGFSNAAAMAGTDATRTAGAMYQLSQAMSSGKVMLMDWRSLEQANITGVRFQETIKTTARAHGIAIDDMIASEGSLRETLKSGWLTSDLMAEALNHYTLSTEEMTDAEIEANKVRLRSLGYTEDQIKTLFELGTEATNAATKVKTFSQMWDVMKETAQSGWSQTWKIIFGDFEEAMAVFTPLTNFFTKIIDRISDARNEFLKAAMGSPFGELGKKLANFTNATGSAAEVLGDYSEIVERVIGGEFGTGQERWDKLSEMGYNWAHAQNLVNERLGNSFRRVVELTEAQGKHVDSLEDLTDEKLKDIGLTEAEIIAYRELERQSKETGKPLSELVETLETRTGRELLIDSVKNFGAALTSIAGAAGKAWREIFDPIKPESLYNALDAFEEFTAGIKAFWENTENLGDLTRVFKGLFAALDIVGTIIGGGFRLAFKAISAVLGLFNMDILDAAAYIGDMIVKLRDWIDEHSLLNKIFEEFGPNIKQGILDLKAWIEETGILGNAVASVTEFMSNTASTIVNWFKGFTKTDDIFGYIVESLQNGAKRALNGIKKLGSTIGKIIRKIFESPLSVIDDFKNKVLSGLGKVGEGISGFIDKIVGFVKSLDIGFGEIATILVGSGMVIAFIKFAKVFGNVVGVITNVSEAFAGIGESISGTFNKIGNAAKIIGLAVAIAIIAKVFLELAKLEWEEVGVGATALLSLSVILGLLTFALGLMAKKSIEITTGAFVLLEIAAAIGILALALKAVASVESDNIIADVLTIGGIGVALAAVTAILSKLAPNISKGSFTMIAIAAAILILVFAISKLDAVKLDDPQRVIFSILGLIAGLALLSAASKGIGFGSGFGVMAMVASLFLFISAIEKLANINATQIKANIEEIAVILAMFGGLMLASSVAGKNVAKAGAGLLSISAALIIVIMAIKLIASIPPSDLSRGTDAISQLLVMFGLITAASFLAGNNAAKAGLMIMEMSVALMIISMSILILAKIAANNEAGLITATNIIVKLMAMFAVIIAASYLAKGAMGTLITIGVVLGLLTVALGALSMISDSDLQSATTSLVLVMGAFAGLIAVTRVINTGKGVFLKTAGTLILMGGIMVLLAGIISKLASLEPGGAMDAAKSLALLLTSLSVSVGILALAGMAGWGALIGIGSLVVLIAAVGGVMAAINAIVDDAEKAEAGLDVAIMVLEKIGTGIGKFVGGIIGGLGAGIFSGLQSIAEDLNAFMNELTKDGGFIDGANSIDEGAIDGIKALMSMIMMFAGAEFLGAIGSLFTSWTDKLAGLFSKDDNPMTGLVEKMSELGSAVVEFSKVTAGLDDTAINRIGTVAKVCETLVNLANSIPNEGGWLGKIVGDNDIEAFGKKLPKLGAGIVSFAESVQDLTDDDVEKIKVTADAAMALTEMADAVPNMGGKLAEFLGENDISVFGEKLASFGGGLVAYGISIRALTEDDIEKIKLSGDAAMGLATMADAVPNMGGKLAEFFGENDLSVFGEKLTIFGGSLVAYGTSIRALTEEDIERINMSAEAAKGLAGVADSVPNMGGKLAEFFGENDLSVFGTQISGFGTCLMTYATSVLGLTDAHIDSITLSKDAVKAMADVARAVPNEGGWLGAIAGENNLTGFAIGMKSIGTCINEYVKSVANVDDKTVKTIKNSKDAVKQLADIAEETPELDDNQNIGAFATNMPKVGTAISKYVGVVRSVTDEDVDAAKRSKKVVDEMSDVIKRIPKAFQGLGEIDIDGIIGKLKKIVTFAGDIDGTNTSGLSALGDNLQKAAKDGITKFIEAFNSSEGRIKSAGINVNISFAKGLAESSVIITTKINAMTSSMVSTVSGKSGAFYSAGANLARGFARGISDFSHLAVAKANAMVNSVVSIVRSGLKINSPSKVFIEIGRAIPEGFAMGIGDLGHMIADSTVAMADVAIAGTQDAIARVAELINADIDSQPTIRPVLDLSDVESGASRINGLFGMQPSVDLLTNVGSINTMMNGRQNGVNTTNDDVVAAIKDLKNAIRESSGDSYSINGITYDDGSNIADTIKSLVRVSRIEGRI